MAPPEQSEFTRHSTQAFAPESQKGRKGLAQSASAKHSTHALLLMSQTGTLGGQAPPHAACTQAPLSQVSSGAQSAFATHVPEAMQTPVT